MMSYNAQDLLRTIDQGLEQIAGLAAGLNTQDAALRNEMDCIEAKTEEVARSVRHLRECIEELEAQQEQATAKR